MQKDYAIKITTIGNKEYYYGENRFGKIQLCYTLPMAKHFKTLSSVLNKKRYLSKQAEFKTLTFETISCIYE